MNVSTSVAGDNGSPALVRKPGWHAMVPVAALVVAQVALYIWLAPRGFDFTDEAFYFLNYLHWRDITATVTFFAVYLDIPFRLLGESVTAIRIFSLLLLSLSSTYFTREALLFSGRRSESGESAPWSFVLVGMAGSLFYFGHLTTLRAPSYNLLALCSMLVATGLLLRLTKREESIRKTPVVMFCYGIAIGVCGLGGKATSGAILVACHILFFALANRDWRGPHLLALVALSLAGVGLNFALLQWAYPQWMAVLQEGMVMGKMTDGRNIIDLGNELRWKLQAMSWVVLPLTAAAVALLALFMRRIGSGSPTAVSSLATILILACLPGLIGKDLKEYWLPLLAATALLLWCIEALSRQPQRLVVSDASDFALMVLLVSLPIAFSFGTNMPVLEHSQMAAVFPIVAVLVRLLRLYNLGLVARPAIVASLVALCVPTLVFQVQAATDVRYTYRQTTSLGEQTVPVQLGSANSTVLVDETTGNSLNSVIGAARTAGFRPGQVILDFTGDGPGWIFALGGRPLGVAWLLGGYPGSDAAAARLVQQSPLGELQRAWILSSDDNPRAIVGWQSLLHQRLGGWAYEPVLALRVAARSKWGEDPQATNDLHLWKPTTTTSGGE